MYQTYEKRGKYYLEIDGEKLKFKTEKERSNKIKELTKEDDRDIPERYSF